MLLRQPQKTANPFYLSNKWRALRRRVLKRDGYRCVICRADVTGKGRARVDHIQPRKTHPHLALDDSNCRTLCTRCDAESHREKGSGSSQREARFSGCDEHGWPLDPSHHWKAAPR